MTKDEFELRGKLATLKCWHRLTQEEEEDLLRFAAAQPAQEPVFCEYCGGNDENPPNHCMDCARPQPEQEPVGNFAKFTDGIWREVTDGSPGVSLYTATQRTWVGLTDEDCTGMSAGDKVVAMWADRTLKEKNT